MVYLPQISSDDSRSVDSISEIFIGFFRFQSHIRRGEHFFLPRFEKKRERRAFYGEENIPQTIIKASTQYRLRSFISLKAARRGALTFLPLLILLTRREKGAKTFLETKT